MLQPYLAELTVYEPRPKNDRGQYDYKYFDHYWRDAGRHPFLLCCDKDVAGFALMREVEGGYSMAEFYVRPEFRRHGIGLACAIDVIGRFKGNWDIEFYTLNAPARALWTKVAEKLARGEIKRDKPEPIRRRLRFRTT
jgi:predicted acetyltransferase